MKPNSRNGPTSHFNLFPYENFRHGAYHDLFWNMTIQEVWDNLDDIYLAIFESDEEMIYPFWLEFCELNRGSEQQKLAFCEERRHRLLKHVGVYKLQNYWFKAFGTADLEQVRHFLRYMMLFMIFGINMANPRDIFNNRELVRFFESYPVGGDRVWAFEICFGKNGVGMGCIKSKTSKIIRKIGGRT